MSQDTPKKLPEWAPDAESTTCKACSNEFGWFTRKHHCRFCGDIFCGSCANCTLPFAGVELRSCAGCFAKRSKPELGSLCRWLSANAAIPTPASDQVFAELTALLQDEEAILLIQQRSVKNGRVMCDGSFVEVDQIELEARPAGSDPVAATTVEMPPEGQIIEWAKLLIEQSPELGHLRFKTVPQRVPEKLFWERLVKALCRRFQSIQSENVADEPADC